MVFLYYSNKIIFLIESYTNVIVLDEATSALDYETEKNILDHLSQYSSNHTLIIITHRENTIESCDYIYKIEEGKVQCIKTK